MRQACAPDKLDYAGRMVKVVLVALALAALILGSTGCASHSGSREYVPGKGWIYND